MGIGLDSSVLVGGGKDKDGGEVERSYIRVASHTERGVEVAVGGLELASAGDEISS